MGGCLGPNKDDKTGIQHNTMNAAQRSTFWENAMHVPKNSKTTESDLNDTVQTWQSANLYEMSTTECAKYTQSKMDKIRSTTNENSVEPSATDVQKDFDINSPIASETFNKQPLGDFQSYGTNSTIQEPQQSFEMTNSASELQKSSEGSAKNSEVFAIPPAASAKDANAAAATTPVKMYDSPLSPVVLKTKNKVDDFDEPKEAAV